ncbi:t-SNARE [Tirmania nivea]|nr:t-SNARE [Tirmania nivea]
MALAEQSEVDFQEMLINEREDDIRQIEQGISELNEIFRDLSTMVNEQGHIIESIEGNIQNTLTSTQDASRELTAGGLVYFLDDNVHLTWSACCLHGVPALSNKRQAYELLATTIMISVPIDSDKQILLMPVFWAVGIVYRYGTPHPWNYLLCMANVM